MAAVATPDEAVSHYKTVIGMVPRGSKDHATKRLDRETHVIDSFGLNDPLRSLLSVTAYTRYNSSVPSEVRSRIRHKFLAGAYGQFPAESLMAHSADIELDAVKESLTIGWGAPSVANQSTQPAHRQNLQLATRQIVTGVPTGSSCVSPVSPRLVLGPLSIANGGPASTESSPISPTKVDLGS